MTAGLVVGAAGGIGGACVAALAGSADRMILADRDETRLNEAAAGLGSATVPVATGTALRWAVIASGVPLRGGLADLDEAAIAEVFQANLVGPALLLRALADVRWTTPASLASSAPSRPRARSPTAPSTGPRRPGWSGSPCRSAPSGPGAAYGSTWSRRA
jgi:NAD(P)-dependent dehydrogenase (short-subunit alcohol dehydrogenase family)